MRSVKNIAVVFLLTFGARAFAKFSYEGYLTDASGNAVNTQSVKIKLQLRTPGAENCLMREETFDVTTGTDGYFEVAFGVLQAPMNASFVLV